MSRGITGRKDPPLREYLTDHPVRYSLLESDGDRISYRLACKMTSRLPVEIFPYYGSSLVTLARALPFLVFLEDKAVFGDRECSIITYYPGRLQGLEG